MLPAPWLRWRQGLSIEAGSAVGIAPPRRIASNRRRTATAKTVALEQARRGGNGDPFQSGRDELL
jgi:hypothetical protein